MLTHHLLKVKGRRCSKFIANSSTTNSQTVTIPVTASAGDIAVLTDEAKGYFSTPEEVIPSEWTAIQSSVASNLDRACFSWKVLKSSDPGVSVSGMPKPSLGSCTKIITVYRILNGKGAPSIVDTAAEATSGNPAVQTVNASSYGYGSITMGFTRGDNNNGAFSSGDFNATVQAAPEHACVVGYKLNNTTTKDNVIDSNDTGTPTVLASWLIIDQ